MPKQYTVTMIASKFDEAFNGQRNFITPDLVRYGVAGSRLYELSKAKFGNDDLYGVTLLDFTGKHDHNGSTCFDSIEEAEQYIKDLRRR